MWSHLSKILKSITIFTFIIFWLYITAKDSYPEDIVTPLPESSRLVSLPFDVDAVADMRAEKGLRNFEFHSIIITEQGIKEYDNNREKEALSLYKKAKELAPDLPLPDFYLTRLNLSASPKDLSVAADYLLKAFRAFCNNFLWSFHTSGILFTSLFLALYLSGILFFIILIISRFRLYIHDVMEDRRKILLLLPSVILVSFGSIFGLTGFLIPFWRYIKARERIAACLTVVAMIFLILTSPLVFSFLGASQDKLLFNVARINQGIFTGESPAALRERSDYEAAFSYALGLKGTFFISRYSLISINILAISSFFMKINTSYS